MGADLPHHETAPSSGSILTLSCVNFIVPAVLVGQSFIFAFQSEVARTSETTEAPTQNRITGPKS
jgi:hypothetical protein